MTISSSEYELRDRARNSSKPTPPRVKLLGDQVLLKLIARERHLHGLYIPDSAKREASELWQGEVIAAGSKATSVKPGDRVVFYFIGGQTAMRWPDDEHMILAEEYIQAVIEA